MAPLRLNTSAIPIREDSASVLRGLNLLFVLHTVRMSDATQLDGKHKEKVVCYAWPSLLLTSCALHTS